ncbi:Spx/MgsR family RNA polymerase-binding regulatory protein [Romeria aff. gracilis LEGE 07310]|uniref:Spx/MgsR family RNA polymerase-binding regulatory protein n=1 Tax=Vasconcelosia minhoensis LEGE 07310 TaxID=915328 RepID=A0A8J7DBV3_9CYAN|nr:Spx/MgsR family RNA polymerase-binding regulatory protein [Romeria gracilis]MBE9078217.1 Spx/MgsR family RNA polymerase-binding regulatory protein [Romeria aff. gracilis LEGE 07310]
MALKIYGIPTCATCKKALQQLDQAGIAYEFINTKTAPPSRETIADWVGELGAKPLRNTSGKAYRAIGPEKQTWDDSQWVDAFAKDAMLLKRPVFVKQGKAVMVGFRNPEAAIRACLE